MRSLLRLTFGIAFASALPFYAACTRTDARPEALKDTRTPAASAEARAAAPESARWGDSDSDGIPDREELRSFNDRESFRKWLTAIAEQQFYDVSREWNAEQRDCAGLVRFAWRESLRAHDRAWFLRMGEAYEHVAPDVRAYTLERSPVGEKLFRTSPGTFDASNLSDGTFSAFADARTLKDYNARFVGRDAARAEAGDLLFFQQPFVQKYPYHVMLFLGRSRADPGAAPDSA